MNAKNFDKRASVEIELFEPIEIDGAKRTSLTMRRPKVADQIAASKAKGSEAEKAVYGLARLCDVAPDDISKLDTVDFDALNEQYEAFTGRQSEK